MPNNNISYSLIYFLCFSSKLPSHSLQKLRQEIDHLKERLTESLNEHETRANFVKKSIQVRQ